MVAALAAATVAFLHGGNLVVVDTATHAQRVVLRHAGQGPVRWSGDGKLVSSGGRIAGGPTLPTAEPVWAPVGETAAYTTRRGGVAIWSPRHGTRMLRPNGWGAQAVAWVGRARLAIGRTICHAPCGPHGEEVWLWSGRGLRRIVRLPPDDGIPLPFAADPRGRVLWWLWPDSGSIAADGVRLYANTTPLATMLMYPDWVARCGRGLALAAGGDRNSMHGKAIVLNGREISRDATRSWISPACNAAGTRLVAAARPDNPDGPWGDEHRALWQLLPTRRRLTSPPRGWSDESPRILRDGSILFVRTRLTSRKVDGTWRSTDHGVLELLAHGTVTRIADVTDSPSSMYYGYYGWAARVAVKP